MMTIDENFNVLIKINGGLSTNKTFYDSYGDLELWDKFLMIILNLKKNNF